jgi:hypothetical protein
MTPDPHAQPDRGFEAHVALSLAATFHRLTREGVPVDDLLAGLGTFVIAAVDDVLQRAVPLDGRVMDDARRERMLRHWLEGVRTGIARQRGSRPPTA